jgi:hypothetical protein
MIALALKHFEFALLLRLTMATGPGQIPSLAFASCLTLFGVGAYGGALRQTMSY